jgi:hypothetical protein
VSVFVGAGLSIPAGYPESDDLTQHLMSEGHIDAAELNGLETQPAIAQRIKDLMEQRGLDFGQALAHRFDENRFPLQPTIPVFEDLLSIPFRAVITTNYDRCLEEAAARIGKPFAEIQVYPHLRPNNLEARKLYHVHGRIDHQNAAGAANSIVYVETAYDLAYGDDSLLPVFINAMFASHSILFIGFSLREHSLNRLLDLTRRRGETVRAHATPPPVEPPYRFAILPAQRARLDSQTHPEEAIMSYVQSLQQEDQALLENYGVCVLRYLVNDIYSEMRLLVSEMLRDTRAATQAVRVEADSAEVPV